MEMAPGGREYSSCRRLMVCSSFARCCFQSIGDREFQAPSFPSSELPLFCRIVTSVIALARMILMFFFLGSTLDFSCRTRQLRRDSKAKRYPSISSPLMEVTFNLAPTALSSTLKICDMGPGLAEVGSLRPPADGPPFNSAADARPKSGPADPVALPTSAVISAASPFPQPLYLPSPHCNAAPLPRPPRPTFPRRLALPRLCSAKVLLCQLHLRTRLQSPLNLSTPQP
mmetsp:Transcript_992/g.3095  ORF Transcript_992/g.3095 Transcript_992/m.3095 type:complete len:228 (-) Transcript_992:97-780(-)